MRIVNCEQLSEEWFAVRRAIPTASNFDKIVTSKGEPSKQREKYLFRLAAEKVSGFSEETYQNAAMVRGIEMEKEAREFYQLVNDVEVEQVGFCIANGGWACSPDGFVGEDGMIEIKCPISSTHVSYLLDNKLPTEYYQQCQGELFVTGRKWLDFISYYPGIKPLIVRVKPDWEFHRKLEIELKGFVKELETIINKIR